jgi:CDP-diacylglycerol--serine O-phosphatidyltransferase
VEVSRVSPRAFRRLTYERRPIPFRRGVALLPSFLTVANMFFGYYAIIMASKHRIEWAVTMVIIAGILDGLDGRIARLTGSTSEFGKELDSLSDFLSFGLAPALILYYWGFKDLGRTGWLFAFLLPVAGAMRLARFNVQAGKVDKRYFVGLNIPSAAAAAVLPLYFLHAGPPSDAQMAVLKADAMQTMILKAEAMRVAALVYVVTLSVLMVSKIKYRSFKELDLRLRRPSVFVFLMAVIIVLIALNPPAVLLGIAVTYAASGPLGWVWGRVVRKERAEDQPAEAVVTQEAAPHEP